MPAEVLFAGGRLDSIEVVSGSVTEVTTGGRFDSSYADCALSITRTNKFRATFYTDTAGVLAPDDVVTGETLYLHFECYNISSSASNNMVEIQDSSGEPWVAIRCTASSSTVYGIYYNSTPGAAPTWVLLGSTSNLGASSRLIHDLKITLGSPHSVEWSLGSSLLASGTFSDAGLTDLRSAVFDGSNNSTGNTYSQIMATRDLSTIGGKVKTSRPTADGSNTGWSGAYTDVNEAVGSDATLQSSTSAGQKETQAMGDVTVSAGFEIKSVFHWMRAKNDGSAPTNIRSVLRSGGVDYSTGDLSGIGTSFGAIGARYNQNPATSANWDQSGWNAIEAGYESAA